MAATLHKSFGYVLLCVGLICIFFAFRSMQDIFNQEINPPDIFQMKTLQFSVSGSADIPSTAISVTMDPQIRKTVNILLYCVFLLFILTLGGKLSSLGIQLIKEKKSPDRD